MPEAGVAAKRRVAIVGGGMAGLGAAYELVARGEYDITIFEKSAALGGLVMTVDVNGEPLEIFYHHMFPNYRDFFEIFGPLGITDKAFFRPAKSAVYYGGKSYPFDNAFDLLKFSPLSFFDRLRTGIVLAGLKATRRWKKYEGVRADEWSRSHFGAKPYAILWEPLLESKFGVFLDRAGMAWFWSRIAERPSKFGYFHGSFKVLADALEKYLVAKGVHVKVSCGVEKMERAGDGTFALTTAQGSEQFDDVVVAAPPAPFLKFASNLLPQDFVARVGELKYLGAICAIMVLKRQLTDYYWLNINDPGFPFVGIIEQSNFVGSEPYGGLHPVYLAKYLDPLGDFYKLSDEEIWAQYLPAVKRVIPAFSEDWIKEKYVFRTPVAQPLLTPDYVAPTYHTPVERLWWVSMSHIYPYERSTDRSFHAGRDLARELVAHADDGGIKNR